MGSLLDLPHALLEGIVNKLPCVTVAVLQCTCRHLRELYREELATWSSFDPYDSWPSVRARVEGLPEIATAYRDSTRWTVREYPDQSALTQAEAFYSLDGTLVARPGTSSVSITEYDGGREVTVLPHRDVISCVWGERHLLLLVSQTASTCTHETIVLSTETWTPVYRHVWSYGEDGEEEWYPSLLAAAGVDGFALQAQDHETRLLVRHRLEWVLIDLPQSLTSVSSCTRAHGRFLFACIELVRREEFVSLCTLDARGSHFRRVAVGSRNYPSFDWRTGDLFRFPVDIDIRHINADDAVQGAVCSFTFGSRFIVVLTHLQVEVWEKDTDGPEGMRRVGFIRLSRHVRFFGEVCGRLCHDGRRLVLLDHAHIVRAIVDFI